LERRRQMARTTYEPVDPGVIPGIRPGALGRLGMWVTDHRRLVIVIWVLLVVGLGAFAPAVEKNLSGAGWQADGSESVAVRDLAQEHFGGNASPAIQVVVHSTEGPLDQGDGPTVMSAVLQMLEDEPRLAEVVPAMSGVSLAWTRTRWCRWPPT
jgi:putative drug exporter of the RND superfamily